MSRRATTTAATPTSRAMSVRRARERKNARASRNAHELSDRPPLSDRPSLSDRPPQPRWRVASRRAHTPTRAAADDDGELDIAHPRRGELPGAHRGPAVVLHRADREGVHALPRHREG